MAEYEKASKESVSIESYQRRGAQEESKEESRDAILKEESKEESKEEFKEDSKEELEGIVHFKKQKTYASNLSVIDEGS